MYIHKNNTATSSTRKNSLKNRPYWVYGLIVVLLLSVAVILKKNWSKPTPNKNTSNTSQAPTPASAPSPTPVSGSQNDDKKIGASPENGPTFSSDITATITNTRVVNSLAQISVLILGTDSGSCIVNMTSNGSMVERSVKVIRRESVVTCDDISVPVDQLFSGVWDISLVIENGDKRSRPATSTLEVLR